MWTLNWSHIYCILELEKMGIIVYNENLEIMFLNSFFKFLKNKTVFGILICEYYFGPYFEIG